MDDSTNLSGLTTAIRCFPAVLLLTVGLACLFLVQTTDFSFSNKPTRDFMWIIGITELLIYVWVRVFARVPIRTQIRTLVLLYGVQLGLNAVVRVDGFMGDGRPIWVWRWHSSAAWNDDQHDATSGLQISKTADLTTRTEFDYPSFRGANRTGTIGQTNFGLDWVATPPKLLWRQPVGLGWSSFAVVGNYCVTQEQRGEFETVVCYELRSGREIWNHADLTSFYEITGGRGPRATPTIIDGKVFALGAAGILNCLNGSDGRRIWSTNILKDADAKNALFGMSGSPLVVNDLVVVSPGGPKASLVAYDRHSGKRVWRGGDAGASYSSPHYAAFAEHSQILTFNAEGIFGHDVDTGIVLWNHGWVSNPEEKNNVGQPIVLPATNGRPDQVFIASGYGKGCALLDIVSNGSSVDAQVRWRNKNLKAKFSSAVRRGGYIYGLDDKILVCLDTTTGKRQWKGGRYGYGQLVLADSTLIIQAESGDIALVEATPKRHRELARFAALAARTWNQPVVSGNVLVVRNDREAACYELPPSTTTQHDSKRP